ncbi:MAG TPA: S8 family serine peptidase [Blastocatellia bacterium]|nr:S8 family serine peptidase [Blastocatellia bacterium]
MKKIKPVNSCSRANRASKQSLRILLAISVIALAVLTLNILPNSTRTASAARAQSEKISDSALSQIRSLMEAKLARTPEQQKIDSNLLAAIKVNRGEAIAANAPTLQPDVKLDANGKVLVDITAKVTNGLLDQLRASGAEDVLAFKQYDSIRARVPLLQLEFLAGSPNIKSIIRAVEAQTQRATQDEIAARTAQSQSFAARANRVRAQLPQAMRTVTTQQDNPGPITNIGAATSAGDTAHAAASARTTFGVNGAGIKIGVLSDSYNNLALAPANVLTGDLPGVGNPNGFTTPVTVLQDLGSGGTDEGRAMMQIVHDLAPGAQLYFATAFLGSSSFANNIQSLRTNGCDIIIDDVFYSNESPFQDAIIAQAVNTVTAAGALYFSSAGNSGNLDDGTSGVWEGDFNDSGVDLMDGVNNLGRLHQFSAGVTLNTVNSGGSSRRIDMMWSDPLAGSGNDYDVYILNAAGTSILRSSDSSQTGTQDPYEGINTLNVGEKIAIVKFSGAARAIHLNTGRARLLIATSGQTKGHSCAADAFGVAAVNAASAGGGAFVGGATNPTETFSSDGTRRVFYNANGTPITPGNVLFATNGGAVRQKPDIAAADGVATTFPGGSGLNPFFSTSAAAPHAGAIAALLKQFKPALTTSQVRTILTSTALDIEAAGIDRDSGVGIVMALAALQSVPNSGTDTIGVYDPATQTFYLRNSNSQGNADLQILYGPSGCVPLVGDWDGNGTTTIGVYEISTRTFYLRNANTPGNADIQILYGPNGCVPALGDFNNDGTTTVGVYESSTRTFYLRNTNSQGNADITVVYGPAGANPLVGDWDGM